MSDNENLPPLEDGQDLTPSQGFAIPSNYDLRHAAYYAHVYGSNNEMLGSAIVDKGAIVQFKSGSSNEFSGMNVKFRYGTPATPPEPGEPDPVGPLDINLYPGWETEGPLTTAFAFNEWVDMIFSLSGTGSMNWTEQYDGNDDPIPGSTVEFVWGDGADFGSKQYEISARIVDRWVSPNQLNYPTIAMEENQFVPLTEGFSLGIREQGWVDSAAGFIIVELTIRQTDDVSNFATGVFRVNKQGNDAPPPAANPMILTINTSLMDFSDDGPELT